MVTAAMPPPPNADARVRLNVPGTLLIVTGLIGLLLSLYDIVASSNETISQATLDLLLKEDVPAEVMPYLENMYQIAQYINIVVLVACGFILYGGIQLRKLKNYPLAVAASILAMIPCQCTCCIGLPCGIWALVILLKPEIQAQFRQAAAASREGF